MNKVSKTYETTLSIPMCVTRDQKEEKEKQRKKDLKKQWLTSQI